MTARLLDGKALAQAMQTELAAEVEQFVRATGVRPGLAAVLVGDRPDSQSYVRGKRKACERVGIESWLHALPATTGQQELLGAGRPRFLACPRHGVVQRLARNGVGVGGKHVVVVGRSNIVGKPLAL